MKNEKGNIKQFKKKDNLFEDFNRKRANHQISKLMWITIIAVAFVLLVIASFVVARVLFINKEYFFHTHT